MSWWVIPELRDFDMLIGIGLLLHGGSLAGTVARGSKPLVRHSMLKDRHRKRASVNLEVELTLCDRDGESGSPLQERSNLIDEGTLEFVDRDVRDPVNVRGRELR